MIKYQRLRQYILDQNVYSTETDDQHTVKTEILATRLYLILLILILYAYAFYEASVTHLITVIISKPTIEQYEELIRQYPDTLQCPCEQISISYKEFLHISSVYHQICSSDFVSQRWMDYLLYENISYYYQRDFRRSASGQFQLLRTFCEQAQDTIDYSLIQFYSNQFLTKELITMETFDIQVNSLVNLFRRTTSTSFLDVLNTIRSIFLRQLFLSGMGASLELTCYVQNSICFPAISVVTYKSDISTTELSCSCTESSICKLSEGFYITSETYIFTSNWFNPTVGGETIRTFNRTFALPGMLIGCVPSESLLYSTGECLFDDSCLNLIGNHIDYTPTNISSFSKLNQSVSTPNTTYETLINNLFVEQWITNQSFDAYFSQCQPVHCQYTNEVGQSLGVTLTSIISLYGGLRVILSSVILFIANFALKKCQHRRTNNEKTSTNGSAKTSCSQLIRKGWDLIKKVNLFDSATNDEHLKRNEILSSQVYCMVLPIVLLTFGIYLSLEKQTRLITIDNPTQTQYEQLQNSSVNDLHCPCNDISIKYVNFLSFQPRYHQICSSVFTSQLWSGSTYWKDTSNYRVDDFRQMSSIFFEYISIVCDVANELVTHSLTVFEQNEYLTSEVVSPDIFKSDIMSLAELFATTTQQSFLLRINLIRRITSANQFINQLRTNTIFTLATVDRNHNSAGCHSMIRSFQGCSCATNPLCKHQLPLYGNSKVYNIPGIYQACLFLDTVLLSTSECFFSQDCINMLKSFMKPESEIYKKLKSLNSSISSQYQSNTTMEDIVNNLFIEEWNPLYFYNQYYAQCQPSFCSYTREEKLSFIDIITKLISIYGGLSLILKIFLPLLINTIRRKSQETKKVPFSIRIQQALSTIKTKLINLNLFRTKTTNTSTIKKQLYTTRFYLAISMITFAILLSYVLTNEKSINVKVELNNLNEYNVLLSKYSTTLNCPCSDISITYDQFIKMSPSYHQICSSDFVTQQWIEFLYTENRTYEKSFYAVASAQFQILSSLCKQVQETVNNSLVLFYATKLTSDQLISSNLFQIQVETIVNTFRTSAPQTFKRTLVMLSSFIHGNAFITPYETNWKYLILNTYDKAPIYANPQRYGGSCSCGTSSKCTEKVQLNTNSNSTLNGMLIGCYIHETLLQSTLECLYDQECLDLIRNSFRKQTSSDDDFRILNSTLLTNHSFGISETVQEMVDRLFVNEWTLNYSYESYYEKCHSTYCTYSYIQNSDMLYIITTILGLFGSLTILLRMFSKFITVIILSIIKCDKNKVVPVSSLTD
ncbi:unnamed protein product [Adineta ricciae]|uniref:Uncharacterized protein n=1 Tax=Adineta ricciae TaxID=249248 RepID=A0A815VF62_ADIRI|nr:unnamed protein product [Adineta ricciae]